MRSGWPRVAWMLVGVGAVLLVLSGALLASRFGESASVEFGWFAYADGGPGRLVVLTTRDLWALAAATLGVGLVAAGAGYGAGSRRVVSTADAIR